MLFFLFILALYPTFCFAEITNIVIEKREPFAGYEFGVTRAYEEKSLAESSAHAPLQ
jgi:hypothetical protein